MTYLAANIQLQAKERAQRYTHKLTRVDMNYQIELERIARRKGVELTPLSRLFALSQPTKIDFCGGLVTRIVAESSADSTVLLRDPAGEAQVFCAIHGDLAHRYPDILATGALACFKNITYLVTGSKMPPLLIACLENLSELLLPSDDAIGSAAAAAGCARGSVAAPAAPPSSRPRPGDEPTAAPAADVAEEPRPKARRRTEQPEPLANRAADVSDDDEDCLELADAI